MTDGGFLEQNSQGKAISQMLLQDKVCKQKQTTRSRRGYQGRAGGSPARQIATHPGTHKHPRFWIIISWGLSPFLINFLEPPRN